MKVGYPCINRSLACRSGGTFRLQSFSEARLIDTVNANLDCLEEMLRFNAAYGLLFLRLTSDLIPFASHPVCRFDWAVHFAPRFEKIGRFIKRHGLRISMHPDQFVVLNSPRPDVVERSVAELRYQARVLDALRLGPSAKLQIHLGGLYGDREQALSRFIRKHQELDRNVRARLCIENDDRLFSLADCLKVHEAVGIPVIFDTFHHLLLHHGETLAQAVRLAAQTWRKRDGVLMVDYSSQKPGGRPGVHAETIDVPHFQRILREMNFVDCDVMLEIKDKEASALRALRVVRRFAASPKERAEAQRSRS